MLAGAPISAPYFSYTYDYWANLVPAPPAYLPDKVYDGRVLGVGQLNTPSDIFVAPDRTVYLADTGNNRIICMDPDYKVTRVITEFSDGSTVHKFSRPEGLFVTDEGELYVADTENGRVVVLDRDGSFLRIIGPPVETDDTEGLLPDNFVYRPRKIVVTPSRHMYVIARDIYDGLLKFNAAGEFAGYIGAPRVSPSLWDIFWSKVATQEQRERRALFLPIEFANIDLDYKGLIMAVKQGPVDKESIKRLNQSGLDVLIRAGFYPPMGDMLDTKTSQSVFIDIVAREAGMYTVLDRQYGRVFTYDSLGNLLYAFGGLGDIAGLFRQPVAVDTSGLDILVLDSAGAFTVFKPTEYGRLIYIAIMLYNEGRYDESAQVWKQVLRFNANYDMAYSGIGRALLRQGDYVGAMTNYKLGQNRTGYSDAFSLYREQLIQEKGGQFMTILIVLLLVLYGFSRTKAFASIKQLWVARSSAAPSYADHLLPDRESSPSKRTPAQRFAQWARETGRALVYSFHLLVHPGEGFWELKYEKKGTLSAAFVILLLVVFTVVFQRQYTGFIFNTSNLERINLLMEALSVLVPFLLWCAVNWALTTLMEGKGTFGEIVIASAYALVPLILIFIPLTIISNFLRLEESAFWGLGILFGLAWTAIMLFVGTMVTHEYSVIKTAGASLMIIAGIAVVLFIGLLFSTVINHMIVFIIGLYSELMFR